MVNFDATFDPNLGHPRKLKIFLLFVISSLLLNINAIACTCTGQLSIQKSLETSAVVLTGRVIRTDFITLGETLNPDSLQIAQELVSKTSKTFLNTPMVLKATIVVTEDFKGIKKNDTIVVYTGIRGATCGFKFEQNKEYVIYAAEDNYMAMFMQGDRERFKGLSQPGTYWTNHCTRTTATVGSEQIALREYLHKSVVVR